MDAEVDHHPCVHQGSQLLPGKLVPLVPGQPLRDRELHLSGKLGVLPLLRLLDPVPQRYPVTAPRRRVSRGQDLGVNNLGLWEAEGDAATLIPEAAPSPVGG